MGIRLVGETVAKKLAYHFQNIDDVYKVADPSIIEEEESDHFYGTLKEETVNSKKLTYNNIS